MPLDAIIFSDVHLTAEEPAKTERLALFLDEVRALAPRYLYCLGDLFHSWVGPGHEGAPEFRAVLERLEAISRAGTPLLFIHGNRDFLVDASLSERLGGMEIAPDGRIVEAGGLRIHLAHGDLLCARDTRYRAMRRVIRSRTVRRLYGGLPLETRLRVAGGMRGMSEREVRAKTTRTLSLSASAVRRLFSGDVDLAVVGHVHRAHRIEMEVRGRRRLLFVLGAWDHGNASWLEIGEGRIVLRDGPDGRHALTEEVSRR